MRIAIHGDGRTLRGNERQLLLIIKGLVARGHAVHVSGHAGSEAGRAFAAAGARVSSIRPRGDLDPFSALWFALWLRRVRPDALLLTSWKRLTTAALAGRLARVPRVVLRLGGMHALGRPLRAALTRRTLSGLVHAVYVNSDDVANHLAAAVPELDPSRIVRIHNAVSLPRSRPARLREQLGLAPHTRIVLGAGGLERRKGFDLAVGALAEPGLEAVHLALAGHGPEEEKLRQQAARLDVAARLHLLGHRRDVPSLLRAVDAFVLPSRREGMPVALMEAMAAELPVVAARAGGVVELLGATSRGQAGWIVPVNDVASLAAALAEVFANPSEARARAVEAARRMHADFTVAGLVSSVERVLAGG
jgi:glycosyltransferase involved in cell wall biosynthesis